MLVTIEFFDLLSFKPYSIDYLIACLISSLKIISDKAMWIFHNT